MAEVSRFDDARSASLKQAAFENGDLIVSYLEQLGVDAVFAYPGGAIEPLLNGLARSERRGGTKLIVARHEAGAAFMAHGYHLESGRLGVCASTTGPGATNLVTGVANAFANDVPMLVITPQSPLPRDGRRSFQESSSTGVNTLGIFQQITHYNTLVTHIEQLEHKLVSAILAAHRARGPVHLSVPLDIMRAGAVVSQPGVDLAPLVQPDAVFGSDSVGQLKDALQQAKQVVFLLGDRAAPGVETIMQLAAVLDAKIISTPHGKGLISAYHSRFQGIIGFAGHQDAETALADPAVDCVVAVGVTFGEWAAPRPDAHLVDPRMIHVDSLDRAFIESHAGKLHVQGDVAAVFSRLLTDITDERLGRPHNLSLITQHQGESTGEQPKLDFPDLPESLRPNFELDSPEAFVSTQSLIKPQRLMRELPRLFAGRGRFLADSGNSVIWAIHYLHPLDRRTRGRRQAEDRRGGPRPDKSERRAGGRRATSGRLFHGSMEFASMGWGIGAAVGLAAADPATPVILLVGDGSLLMNGQEMTVALQHNLKVVFVVLNDGCIGTVKHGQRLSGAEPVGFELPKVDFAAMAEAMGVSGIKIGNLNDLLALDAGAICARQGPTVIDVAIDPEEVPPMGARMKWLGK
ncbi:MAG: thiamine pyrophosphate-binding protein [Gammaproteobacteria bacterium]|nr:thiamine pyrophosphate-binding protein [Gammaproteobacteria bacterium]